VEDVGCGARRRHTSIIIASLGSFTGLAFLALRKQLRHIDLFRCNHAVLTLQGDQVKYLLSVARDSVLRILDCIHDALLHLR
jgi:hypothetical protein